MLTEEPPILDESEKGQPVEENSTTQEISPLDIELANLENKVPSNSIPQAYADFMRLSENYFNNLVAIKSKTDSQSASISQSGLFSYLTHHGLIQNLSSESSTFTVGENGNPIDVLLSKNAQAKLTLTEQYLLLRQIAILRTTQDPLGDNKFAEKIKNDRGPFNKGFADKVLAATWRTEKAFTEKYKSIEERKELIYQEVTEEWRTQFIKDAMDLDEAHLYLLDQNPRIKSEYAGRHIDLNKEELPILHQATAVSHIYHHANTVANQLINNNQYNCLVGSPKQKAITYFTKNERKKAWEALLKKTTEIQRLLDQSEPEKNLLSSPTKTKQKCDALAEAIKKYLELVNEKVSVLISIFDPERESIRQQKMDELGQKLQELIYEVLDKAVIAMGRNASKKEDTLFRYDLLVYPYRPNTPISSHLNKQVQLLAAMVPLLGAIPELNKDDGHKDFLDQKVSDQPDSPNYSEYFSNMCALLVNPVIRVQAGIEEDSPVKFLIAEYQKHWESQIFWSVLHRLIGSPPHILRQFSTLFNEYFKNYNASAKIAKQAARYAYSLYGTSEINKFDFPLGLKYEERIIVLNVFPAIVGRVNGLEAEFKAADGSDLWNLKQILGSSKDPMDILDKINEWLEIENQRYARSNEKWAQVSSAINTPQGIELKKYIETIKNEFYVLLTKRPSISGFSLFYTQLSILEVLHRVVIEGRQFNFHDINFENYDKMEKIQLALEKMGEDEKNPEIGLIINAISYAKYEDASSLHDVNLRKFLQNRYISKLIKDPSYLKTQLEMHIRQGEYNTHKPITEAKLIAIVYVLAYWAESNSSPYEKDLVIKVAKIWEVVMIPDDKPGMPRALRDIIRNNYSAYFTTYNSKFWNRTSTNYDAVFESFFKGLKISTEDSEIEFVPDFREPVISPKITEQTQANGSSIFAAVPKNSSNFSKSQSNALEQNPFG